ncbi:MAG: proline--tRNA ligase [Patescibacteria group bacterium]|nr:proline--tRNA ligase [Patescibacteria group bacterium]
MLQSQLFAKIKKETPKEAEVISHKYLVRGEFIEQSFSGVYRFLPLGFRVLKKIEEIIRAEMRKLGAQELYLPALQNKNFWLETNRWETIDPPLFKLKDRHQKETALGSTHEEEITDIVRKRIKSYRDLPFSLFQIQEKFRNEIRATGGLLRTREFLMKDLYSFHSNEKDLINFYQKVKMAYFRIFKRCGLTTLCVEAATGTIGGELSHEFMVLSEAGEDRILICKKCNFGANIEKIGERTKCPKCKGQLEKRNSIEVGHIFNLGTKYSQAMGANFVDKNGKSFPIVMGCYGIGLPRLMAAIVEIWHDEKGIIWPKEVAPFQIHLIPIESTQKVKKIAKNLYQDLQEQGIEVLYDDREDKTPGEKFAEADLIGIPYRIVISERTIKSNSVEVKERKEKGTKLVKIKSLSQFLNSK